MKKRLLVGFISVVFLYGMTGVAKAASFAGYEVYIDLSSVTISENVTFQGVMGGSGAGASYTDGAYAESFVGIVDSNLVAKAYVEAGTGTNNYSEAGAVAEIGVLYTFNDTFQHHDVTVSFDYVAKVFDFSEDPLDPNNHAEAYINFYAGSGYWGAAYVTAPASSYASLNSPNNNWMNDDIFLTGTVNHTFNNMNTDDGAIVIGINYSGMDGLYYYLYANDSTPNPIPEPATMLLFGTGIAGLAGTRLSRKKNA